MKLKKGEVWRTESRKGPLVVRLDENVDTDTDMFFDATLMEGTPGYLSRDRDPEEPGEQVSMRTGIVQFVERVEEQPHE